MKDTGMVRKVDNLGRVVLPKELRTIMDINLGDPIEIYSDDGTIILHKYNPACLFCGELRHDVINYKGKNICRKCLSEMRSNA